MKIRVLSDLHLEFQDWTPPESDADVVVLAGDIHVGTRGIDWARQTFPSHPVVYVPGNHEFYRSSLQVMTQELQARGKSLGVDVLDGQICVINGVRFIGTTLWTDFALHGSDPDSIKRAMVTARNGAADFHLIRYEKGAFRPEHARMIHAERVHWLQNKLAEEFSGPTVVVTHHLPLRESIHPKFKTSDLNPSFASDLGGLVGPPVALWIHGHTHESLDYKVNGTRVVCNPRGYLPMEPNRSFDPLLTVDIPSM